MKLVNNKITNSKKLITNSKKLITDYYKKINTTSTNIKLITSTNIKLITSTNIKLITDYLIKGYCDTEEWHCLYCGISMGKNNSRQLCKKSYCENV